MKFYLKSTAFILVCATAMGLVLYRNDVANYLTTYSRNHEDARLRKLVGANVLEGVLVRVGNRQQPEALASLVGNGGALMTYSSNCSACRSATNQIVAELSQRQPETWPPVFVLLRSADDTPPALIPPERVLTFIGDDSPFASQVSPVFWEFNADSQIKSIEVGYRDVDLTDLLGRI